MARQDWAWVLAGAFSMLSMQSVSAEALKCGDDADNQTMIQCTHQDYQKADKELNDVYAKLMKSTKESFTPDITAGANQDPAADLKDAQKKWIAFRDANCRFAGTEMLGGTGQPLIVNGCLASMTKDRVKELKGFLGEGN